LAADLAAPACCRWLPVVAAARLREIITEPEAWVIAEAEAGLEAAATPRFIESRPHSAMLIHG